MIRALIVDDEPPAREELRFYIEEHKDFRICGEASGGIEALEVAHSLKPDVVFLDIQLWDLDGIMVARLLLKEPQPPMLVFATAYDSYAVQAFELNALDYLLKPYTAERVAATLERVLQRWQQRQKEERRLNLDKLIWQLGFKHQATRLVAWKDERLLVVSPEDIIFAEAQGHHVWLNTKTGKLRFPGTLQELESRLDPCRFRRVHRSFLINIDFVAEVVPYFHGSYRLLVKNNKEEAEIPVGRTYLRELREVLGF